MESNIKELIYQVLIGYNITSIILFGSRARNEHTENSDYDIMVILKDSIGMKERISLTTLIRKKLAQSGIDADAILKSRDEIEYYRNKCGSIVKAAVEEGVLL